jgi:hypothetical protein
MRAMPTLIAHGERSMEVVEKSHISCPEVTELLGDYVERSLPRSLHLMVESHVRQCSECRCLTKDYIKTIKIAHTFQDRPLPEGTKNRLFKALSERLGIELPFPK